MPRATGPGFVNSLQRGSSAKKPTRGGNSVGEGGERVGKRVGVRERVGKLMMVFGLLNCSPITL